MAPYDADDVDEEVVRQICSDPIALMAYTLRSVPNVVKDYDWKSYQLGGMRTVVDVETVAGPKWRLIVERIGGD